MKISEKQTQAVCRPLNFSVADFRARVSALLEAGMASQTQEERCSLSLPEWLKPGSLSICCLKMYPVCLTMTAAGRLRRSSMRWTDWGMVWNGRCSTAKIFACPSQDAGCTLWDILMPTVPEKYYLCAPHCRCCYFPYTSTSLDRCIWYNNSPLNASLFFPSFELFIGLGRHQLIQLRIFRKAVLEWDDRPSAADETMSRRHVCNVRQLVF